MPDAWDPVVYRDRAAAWRQRAMLCENERERNACVALADGYDRLADLIDAPSDAATGPTEQAAG